jgi:hypothetical protein
MLVKKGACSKVQIKGNNKPLLETSIQNNK